MWRQANLGLAKRGVTLQGFIAHLLSGARVPLELLIQAFVYVCVIVSMVVERVDVQI